MCATPSGMKVITWQENGCANISPHTDYILGVCRTQGLAALMSQILITCVHAKTCSSQRRILEKAHRICTLPQFLFIQVNIVMILHWWQKPCWAINAIELSSVKEF